MPKPPRGWFFALFSAFFVPLALADERPAAQIQDNSFFIEEAYNQEAGIVQHILNGAWSQQGRGHREWSLLFTQEWPVFSQAHQFSYSIPYSFLDNDPSVDGIGDVQLNYRWQALMETDSHPAFAPRISLILPTGDEDKGLGSDTVGYQVNLPVSKIISDRWTLHANAGATLLPDVNDHDLLSYNLGASAIYAVSADFNLMLECLGNWDEDVDDAGDTDRSFSAILSPGARYAFNFEHDTQLVLGIAFPVGLTSDAPDYGVFLYLSFEHPFGR